MTQHDITMGVIMPKINRIGLLLIGLSFLFCLYHGQAWAEDIKIGVLNMKRLQQNSVKFQKLREELKQKFNALQKKLDAERDQINKLEEELQKQSMMLSLDAKEGKEMELGKKTRHYKYMYEEVTQEMKNAEYEATRKVGSEIQKIVEKIAQSEGYSLILEEGTMGLIYYNNVLDITDRVTKAYDASN
jgi:outer membrane protein